MAAKENAGRFDDALQRVNEDLRQRFESGKTLLAPGEMSGIVQSVGASGLSDSIIRTLLDQQILKRITPDDPMSRLLRNYFQITSNVRDAMLNAVGGDDSSFVAAKTLREQRRMTAADCNKFLKEHGTESAQSVAGKIRKRKPNKKVLEIHAADWLKFWQDFDRRQSDALDEDAMQEFLANAEAEKVKVKSKRKVGRASSRKVS